MGGRAGEELEGQSLETRGQNSPRPPGYFDTETDAGISRCWLVYGLQLATLGGCGGGSRK